MKSALRSPEKIGEELAKMINNIETTLADTTAGYQAFINHISALNGEIANQIVASSKPELWIKS